MSTADTGEPPVGLRSRLRRLLVRAVNSYVVVIVAALLVGALIAPAVADVAPEPERATVAVVPLEGGIDAGNAESVVGRLAEARSDPDTAAVVLAISSGGGAATASEEIYMSVRRTAEELPVIVSVRGIAASGAYYSAAPADEIVVKPSSFVGSIGVIFVAPLDLAPLDRLVITGPNKLTGADLREWQYKIETDRRAFVSAVRAGRGDRLVLSDAELSYAKLYSGSEGIENGLADRVGNTEDAIKLAANRAGLSNYRVEVLGYDRTVSFVTQTAYLTGTAEEKRLRSPAYFVRDPRKLAVPNPLFLPPSIVRAGVRAELENASVDLREVNDNASLP